MKPKCNTCDKSLKRPYERVGQKGTIQSLKSWWYCSKCKKMVHEPYSIPLKPQDYSNPEAGKIYPEISKEVTGDLSKRHENISELEEFINFRLKSENNYLKETYPFPRPKLEVVWSCINCGTRERVDPEILNNEDSEELSPPLHCKDRMKMVILKGNQVYQEIRKKHNKIIQESIEVGDTERAGIGFLDLVLAFLEDYSHTHFATLKGDMIDLSTSNDHHKKILVRSWGYKMGMLILQSFVDPKNMIRNNGPIQAISNVPIAFPSYEMYVTLREFASRSQYLYSNNTNANAAKLKVIFNDIIQIFAATDPLKIPDYRLKFTKILDYVENPIELTHSIGRNAFHIRIESLVKPIQTN